MAATDWTDADPTEATEASEAAETEETEEILGERLRTRGIRRVLL